jgi:hypothetical protein
VSCITKHRCLILRDQLHSSATMDLQECRRSEDF